jgi:hypothetical protein
VLVPAITQSLRSVLFTLIPAGIITFLAWAIAGSAYASTTDPFRSATWIFLGSHMVPFNLHIPPSGIDGWLTYLPLGAMVLPAIAITVGARKVLEKTNSDLAVWSFAAFYTILVVLLSILSSNHDVFVKWYWAIAFTTPFVFAVTFFAINQFKFTHSLIYLTKSWAIIFGFAAIITGISLLINLRTVHQLTTVLQPGFIGGILLFALTLIYLPNFLISTVAYLVGAGFAVGRDTLIAPLSFSLGKIPALPILGALPTGRHPLYLFGSLVVIGVGAQVAIWTLDSGRNVLRQTIALFLLSSFVIAYLGSGALITYELGTVGPSLWKFPLIISAEFLLGVGLVRVIPIISQRFSSR